MTCPGCSGEMDAVPLTDRNGLDVEIDVCKRCQVFWFDHRENVRLGAAATLKLFDIMAARDPVTPTLSQPLKCPRCDSHLLDTHDMQLHGTRFEYWRCPHDDGHLITYLQFLKEKDFVRPMTPQQIAELREEVRTINCANCGAPVDLVTGAVCSHCGSPLTMLDMKQIADHVRELQQQAAPSPDVEIAKQFAAAVVTLAAEAHKPPADESLVWSGLRHLVYGLARSKKMTI